MKMSALLCVFEFTLVCAPPSPPLLSGATVPDAVVHGHGPVIALHVS